MVCLKCSDISDKRSDKPQYPDGHGHTPIRSVRFVRTPHQGGGKGRMSRPSLAPGRDLFPVAIADTRLISN